MKGPITGIRHFVRDQLANAEITMDGRISTPTKGKLPVVYVVDMYYQWLRKHEDEYAFFLSNEAPMSYIKSEIKIRTRNRTE